MAETNVVAGARPAAGNNGSILTAGVSGSARVAAVRPASPVGTSLAFSQALNLPPKSSDSNLNEEPVTLRAGSGMLSKDVQFLLAETRMQEEQATIPAPSNIGRAIDSYAQTQARVRETIGAVRLASRPANLQQQNTTENIEAAA
ncbi:hypothetical protein [Kordiimonas aquimaris]|uniref:hypothetical protein n=1 Tax=Kordiimonas aquimaris TaxID=707591 RepID=UPI0021CE760E|nr:hypothetical protein [Kordiimonas aquimaris]